MLKHLFFLVATVLPVALSAAEAPPVAMELVRVSEHGYYVQGAAGTATENAGFISNAGVVITADGIVVFDALGTPALAQMLVERIRAVSTQPIRKVVVSHYHADHIYGLQVFKALGAEIIAPRGVENYLGSEQAARRLEERRESLAPWVDENTRLVWPDRYLEGSESFELGGVRFTLTRLGAAHSDADLSMSVEPDGVLYSGDILFEGRVPFIGDGDTGDWVDNLRRLSGLQVKAVVPGHGGAAGDPQAVVESTLHYLEYLRDTMRSAVQELVPFDEAYAAADWSAFESLPAFAASHRRNAYQVYLALEAAALSE